MPPLLIQELILLGHPYNVLYLCQYSIQQMKNQTTAFSEKVLAQLLFLFCSNFTQIFILLHLVPCAGDRVEYIALGSSRLIQMILELCSFLFHFNFDWSWIFGDFVILFCDIIFSIWLIYITSKIHVECSCVLELLAYFIKSGLLKPFFLIG